VSTLIGMPAVAKLDLRRFPFAAAVLSGDDVVVRLGESAIKHLELDAAIGVPFGPSFSRSELKGIAAQIRRELRPPAATIRGVSAFASEWGKDPAKRWPNVSSRFD